MEEAAASASAAVALSRAWASQCSKSLRLIRQLPYLNHEASAIAHRQLPNLDSHSLCSCNSNCLRIGGTTAFEVDGCWYTGAGPSGICSEEMVLPLAVPVALEAVVGPELPVPTADPFGAPRAYAATPQTPLQVDPLVGTAVAEGAERLAAANSAVEVQLRGNPLH